MVGCDQSGTASHSLAPDQESNRCRPHRQAPSGNCPIACFSAHPGRDRAPVRITFSSLSCLRSTPNVTRASHYENRSHALDVHQRKAGPRRAASPAPVRKVQHDGMDHSGNCFAVDGSGGRIAALPFRPGDDGSRSSRAATGGADAARSPRPSPIRRPDDRAADRRLIR